MTTTPNFDDLTPPSELMEGWVFGNQGPMQSMKAAARWGWEQARQLWPEGNANAPTENDADEFGYVMAINASGYWEASPWHSARDYGMKWLHTPRWQPQQPSLKEQALTRLRAELSDPGKGRIATTREVLKLAVRALEQAGEGKA